MTYTAIKFLCVLLMVNGLQGQVPVSKDKCHTDAKNCFEMNNHDVDAKTSFSYITSLETVENTTILELTCSILDEVNLCINDQSCVARLRFEFYPGNVMCEHREDIMDSLECWTSHSIRTASEACAIDRTIDDCRGITEQVYCIREKIRQNPVCSKRNMNFVDDLVEEFLNDRHSYLCAETSQV